jgi:2,4-dienoyl-CoA reductase-like NADH-dependent reductase (Old Yellow Enzyme family)
MVVWSPFRFNSGREMANRFAIAPLTTDSSHDDGTATENELEFVRRRAASGFGAAISSAAYVEQDGRSWQGIGATHDEHLSLVFAGSLKRCVLQEVLRSSKYMMVAASQSPS